MFFEGPTQKGGHMKCDDIKNLLSEYIDGALNENDKAAVSLHLDLCRDCREELNLIKNAISTLKTIQPVELPQDFVIQVRKKIEARRGLKEAIRFLFFPWHIKIPVEALATVIIAGLLYSVYHESMPTTSTMPIREEGLVTQKKVAMPTEKNVIPAIEKKDEELSVQPVTVCVQGRGLSIDKDFAKEVKGEAQAPVRQEMPAPAPMEKEVEEDSCRMLKVGESSESTDGGGLFMAAESVVSCQSIKSGRRRGFSRSAGDSKRTLISLFINLKNPSVDVPKIKRYLLSLGASGVKVTALPNSSKKIIRFRLESRYFPKLINRLIQMKAINPASKYSNVSGAVVDIELVISFA